MMIACNIAKIRQNAANVCAKIGRNVKDITIVAVSKTVGPSEINQAVSAGITDIGESRVQEAKEKFSRLKAKKIKWHLIGHLQTNKVKDAVRLFDLIQSVDSFRLAQEINKQARALSKIQDVLIEVNTAGEETKYGVEPGQTFKLFAGVSELKNISVQGLMTIAPFTKDTSLIRQAFSTLRNLREEICNKQALPFWHLSMGMTDDYEIAIEEGATILRLGRAIFG